MLCKPAVPTIETDRQTMTDKSQEHQSLNIWLNTNQTHWYSCPWCYEGYDHVTCLGRRGASLPVLDGTLRCCWCCWPGWRRPTSSCPRPVFRSRLKYDQIFFTKYFSNSDFYLLCLWLWLDPPKKFWSGSPFTATSSSSKVAVLPPLPPRLIPKSFVKNCKGTNYEIETT